MRHSVRIVALAALSALFASGCAMSALNPFDGDDEPEAAASNTATRSGGGLFGGGNRNDEGVLGVNAYLWRASLDTIDFMPLTEVDPFGGVIITDWYNDPDLPSERFKATVYILDRELRADALKVSVFKQAREADGGWIDTATDPDTARQIENAILTRARQLRISNIEN